MTAITRALVALLFAVLLAPLAQAQAPLNPAPTCAWWEQPATLRTGVSTEPLGAWAAWWCPADRFSPWVPQITAVRLDMLASDKRAQLAAALAVRDMPAALALRTHAIRSPELLPVWVQDGPAILAAKPPGPAWIVAPNGASSTRPAYPITDGIRSSTSTARAEVRATCDCKVRSVEGASVYCATNQERTLVALCRPL